MTQAKRLPRKQPKKKAARKKSSNPLPWGLISVVLVCGVVLGLLLSGTKVGDTEFGVGIKEMFKEEDSSLPQTDNEIAELIDNKSSEKEFDFYELLPDIEKVMPDDLPEATPDRPSKNYDYYLQAASFRTHPDAEKLRARLALKGYKSITQAREVNGKGTFYRVRLGPYADKRKAKTAKNKLQKLGVRPFVFTVEKS